MKEMDMIIWHNRYAPVLAICIAALGVGSLPGCVADADDADNPEADDETSGVVDSAEEALTNAELSNLVLGGTFLVTNAYAPNGVHAGIDFGGTGDGVTSVNSPVNGTITANTSACGKVAIFDGTNTIIMAHMTSRTPLAVGAVVTMGTYLGKASQVVGGGCSASGPHLHTEIRTGNNPVMAAPANNNTNTTRNPLTYSYPPFPSVALVSPANGAHPAAGAVSFSWSPIQGANTFRLQISSINSFDENTCLSGCTYNTAASTTSRSVSLGAGHTYYWRVRAGNSGQGGSWSAVRSVIR